MKHLFFNFNRLLLLGLAVMTVGNVWGTYTITFKSGTTSTDGSTAQTTIANLISDGSGYVSSISATNAYNAKKGYGIKLGASKKTGNVEMTMASSGSTIGQVKASSMSMTAAYYDSGKSLKVTVTYTDATTSETTVTPTSNSMASYAVTVNSTKTISKIKIATVTATSGRMYVGSVTVTTASGYTVTCEATPSGYGSVDPTSVSNVASGTSISKNGATLTIGTNTVTATAADQTAEWTYAFSDWSWSPSGSTVTAATTATATFTRSKRTYDVSKTLNNCSVTSGSIPTTAEYGGSINATITANSGYQLPADITVTGGTKSWNQSTGALSITNITGAVSITITATAACSSSITITKGTESHGTFTLSPTGSVCIDGGNATATISNISPATHYHFKEITTSASGSVDNDQKKVTNISASTMINVTFEEDPKYTVTFTDAMHSTDCSTYTMSNQYAGVQIVFPSLTDKDKHTPSGDCLADHYHFVGWVESGVTPTQSPSNVIAAGTTSINISKTVTYKAVWAKEAQ